MPLVVVLLLRGANGDSLKQTGKHMGSEVNPRRSAEKVLALPSTCGADGCGDWLFGKEATFGSNVKVGGSVDA